MNVERVAIALAICAATIAVAYVVDRVLARSRPGLPPESLTRLRFLRRSITAAIVVVGLALAAFVFPSVRAVAGGLITSAAVLGVIAGLAARSSLGNFFSGLVLAFSQPMRIGDRITFRDTEGVVHEVGRIFTRMRTPDGSWLSVPNELLVSDTIRNWTIVSPECTTEVSLLVPLSADLEQTMEMALDEARAVPGTLAGREPAAQLADLVGDVGGTKARLTVSVWVPDASSADQVSSDLRLRIHRRLREAGVFAQA